MRTASLLLLLAIGCESRAPEAPATCACTPTGRATTVSSGSVLALLRRHAAAVRDGHANGRDTKLIDDELRLQSAILCEPCGAWIGERARADEIYPLAQLDQAAGAVCAGLQLRDGTLAYGAARPAECRGP